MTRRRIDPLSLVRPHLLELAPYEAVDPPEKLAKRAGIPVDRVVKLDANENPYGPSPKALAAIASLDNVHVYPDPRQTEAREAVARYVGIGAGHVVIGNGSDEIIDLLFRALLDPGDVIVDSTPTFGMYPFTAHVCGGTTLNVERDEHFEVDVEAVLREAAEPRVKAIVLASPNNPTANATPLADIERLLASERMVIIDEAYHEFGGSTAAKLVPEHPNLVIMRTMSKWAGLAGLRVGYGLMALELADLLLRAKPPYNVSQAAEAALIASLDDAELLHRRAAAIVAERDRLAKQLSAIPGLHVLPSDSNFVLCRVPDGKGAEMHASLAAQGVFVRYSRGHRLVDCLRISIGRPTDTDRLIAAVHLAMQTNG